MSEFFINEDFPCNEFEFEKRFGNEQACRDYLAHMKLPDGFQSRKCNHVDTVLKDYYRLKEEMENSNQCH